MDATQHVLAAKEAAMTTAASDAPWTPEEEALLSATAHQTARFAEWQVQGYRDAYKPTALHGRTRMDQLLYEAVTRESARRDRLAANALTTLEASVPMFRHGTADYGLKAHPALLMDAAAAARLRRMAPPGLEAELKKVMDAVGVFDAFGRPIPRHLRTRVSEYTRDLRGRIAKSRDASRQVAPGPDATA